MDFVSAIRKSTDTDPRSGFGFAVSGGDPARRQEMAIIAKGLAITLLPAAAVDVLLHLLLTRPRASLARRAPVPQQPPDAGGIAAAEAGEIESRPKRREILLAGGHRLLLAALVLLLNLIPIIGFGVTAGVLLNAGLVTTRAAHLSIVGAGNAYLVCRISLEILRFFRRPVDPELRLFKIADAHAIWLNRWLRILLATGGFCYAIVSISEILGLPRGRRQGGFPDRRPHPAYRACRDDLAQPPGRCRLAAGQAGPAEHICTLAPAIGGKLALLGAVLRPGPVGGMGWRRAARLRHFAAGSAVFHGRHHHWPPGLEWQRPGLERLFPDPSGRELRHPNFIGRARAYNPLIRTLIRIFIVIAVLAVILLGWGVQLLPWLLKNPLSRSLLTAFAGIIVIVAVALVIWEIANSWLDRRIDRLAEAGKTRQALRAAHPGADFKGDDRHDYRAVGRPVQPETGSGVNAAPLLAGAGVLGIAIGFGSQKLVQDIITGLFLLLEDTMQVGDVVTLAGMSGTVERLSIRTIRLRGGDGSVNIIPFSAVTTVTNQTRGGFQHRADFRRGQL